eukprot:4805851-Amphidinium_carterae.1
MIKAHMILLAPKALLKQSSTVRAVQVGSTRHKSDTCTWPYSTQFSYRSLKPSTIKGDGPRVFAGYREEKAYRNAVNNAFRIASIEHRCRLWKGGCLPEKNDISQHMDLPPTEPHTLELAMFCNKNSIKLLHTEKIIENNELLAHPLTPMNRGDTALAAANLLQVSMPSCRAQSDGPHERQQRTGPAYQKCLTCKKS